MDTQAWLDCPMTKCLFWGLILVLLILVLWKLWQTSENMGEWGNALTDLDRNYRSAEEKVPNQLIFQKEQFKRTPWNVDPKADKLESALTGN